MTPNNIVISSTKEVSTGTSTAALVEATLHGCNSVLLIIIVGGYVVALILHRLEKKYQDKLNVKGVRNYGIIRIL